MRQHRIIHLSDLHLSHSQPCFVYNWEVCRDHVRSLQPDLVVVTGDLTLHGIERPDEFDFVQSELVKLGFDVACVPGNHDVGNPPGRGWGDVSLNAVSAFRDRFGADWWIRDLGEWRLIGLNSQVLGTGLTIEAEMLDFFEEAVTACQKPIILFQHEPLFVHTPWDADGLELAVQPKARWQLLKLMSTADVRLVATGHLHRHRRFERDGRVYSWSPGTSFPDPAEWDPIVPGRSTVGFAMYDLSGTDIAVSLVEPDATIGYDLTKWFGGNSEHGYAKAAARHSIARAQIDIAADLRTAPVDGGL